MEVGREGARTVWLAGVAKVGEAEAKLAVHLLQRHLQHVGAREEAAHPILVNLDRADRGGAGPVRRQPIDFGISDDDRRLDELLGDGIKGQLITENKVTTLYNDTLC